MKAFVNYLFLISCIIPFSGVFAQGDSPCTATPMTVSTGICGTYTGGTTVGATYSNNAANGGTPSCASPGAPDVWYSFTASANGLITITTTAGSITDGAMQLFSSSNNLCSGTLTALNCDDDTGPGLMPELNLCGLTPGNTYFLRFWAYGGSITGTFNICFYIPAYSSASSTNCSGGAQVCNNNTLPGNNSGGGSQELNVCNRGCLSSEHNSSWYNISIGTTGTLQMTISPNNGTDDYDFALWGPTNACPPPSNPIRCSFAAGGGNTGINSTTNSPQTDNSEGAGGNKWVQDVSVTAGETYILLVDGFTSASQAFTLSWNTSGGGASTLSCTPIIVLPIELLNFGAIADKNKVLLNWSTATETNNDHFTIERSKDGFNFEELTNIKGSGNSTVLIHYSEIDYKPFDGISYYRLKQTDFNGIHTYSNIVPVECYSNGEFKMSIFPNPGTLKDIKLQLDAAKGQEILVVVRDLTGRELYSKVVVIETTNGQIEAIDNSKTISPGIYLVTASSNNAIYSQKLIIKE